MGKVGQPVMTDTPNTDAAATCSADFGHRVSREFAREQERTIAERDEEIDRWRACGEVHAERKEQLERLENANRGYFAALRQADITETQLRAQLNEAHEATGIFGVDEPMSLLESVRALRAQVAERDDETDDWKKRCVILHDRRDELLAENKALRAQLEASERAAPVAWTIPGSYNADMNGFIPAHIERQGEFTKPLYEHPSAGTAEGET
jgi:hypothetical protein